MNHEESQESPVGDILNFPGERRRVDHGHVVIEGAATGTDGASAAVTPRRMPRPAVPPAADEVIIAAPVRRLPSGPVDFYRGRPLHPDDVGRLRYATSVAGWGTLRSLPACWDRLWDWLKLAPLREGGTHRGDLIERHAQAYVVHQRQRAQRVGLALVVATKPWHTRARIGRMPVPVAAWGLTAGEFATAAYPTNPLLTHTFGLLNGLVGDLAGAAVTTVSPLMWPAAGVAGLAAVVQGIKAEHRARRKLLQVRQGAEVGVMEDGELLPAIPLADAPHPTTVLEAVRRALLIEKVLVKPLAASPTPWGWEVTVQLRKGKPREITAKTAELETLLDVAENGVLVQPHRDRRAQVTLRLIESDPWADLPQAPNYQGSERSRSIRDRIWLGQRLDGQPIETSFLGKQSIVLAASGGGKSILLRLIVDGLAACSDVHLWDLDPSGVGQAPQAKVMRKTALTPEDCEVALAQALAIAMGRTRMLRRLKMGDAWKPSQQRRALVLIIDEFPRLTDAGKKMAIGLLRIARKAGVVLIFATQDATKGTLGEAIAGQVAFAAGGPGLQDWQADLLFGVACKAAGWDPGRYKPATSADQPMDAGVFFFRGTGAAGGDMALPSKTGYMSGSVAEVRAEAYAAAECIGALDTESLQTAGLTAEEVYTHTDEDQADAAHQDALHTPVSEDTPRELSDEALALLSACAEVYAEVTDEWIATQAITEEIAVGELGWPQGKATEMRVSELLDEAGVAKTRKRVGPGGKQVTAVPRAGLLAALDPELITA